MLCKGGVRVSEECIDFSQEQESEDSLREREGDNEGNIYKPWTHIRDNIIISSGETRKQQQPLDGVSEQ